MTRLPDQGAHVQLRDQHGGTHLSEVVQRDQQLPGTLLLSPPADLPDCPYPPGTRLLVSWPEDGAYWVLPVLLVELGSTDGHQVLVAEVNDDAWREERRQFVRRSAWDASVELDLEVVDEHDEPGPSGVAAELIDLSEVALRGVVHPEHRDWFQPDVPVTVRLTLAGDRFDITGTVLLAKATARPDHGLEVVVMFDRPVARADELRQHIAKQQAQ